MASIYDLKPGFQTLLRPLVRRLAAGGVTANSVTIAAIVLSCAAGIAVLLAPTDRRVLLLLPLALFVRMALNAIDGMLAREHAWFATRVIGILPIARRRRTPDEDPLASCDEALRRGEILIFFPEGSRGEPETLGEFKRGIGILAERHPDVPIYPLYLHGLGKALPRNEALLVPFTVDVFVGEPLHGLDAAERFVDTLRAQIVALSEEGEFPTWD